MKVGRYNYPAHFPEFEALMSDLRKMILAGRYILTKEVEAFEKAFAEMHNTQFGCGVNTGTDALAIAFAALGIQAGDEIITQANTFNATVSAIRLVGAVPVLVDADEQTFLMDGQQVEQAITPRTRAIVPVHLYGKPTPMESILGVAAKHGVQVIEDAAQAHGARIQGRRVGSFGLAGCFSFHPSKNLAAAGDGGAIVTNDETLAERICEIRSLGQRGANHHIRPGFNSKLDSIQARILHAKLPHLDRWNEERRKVAAMYREQLKGLPLVFQAESTGEEHAYHLFPVRFTNRAALLDHLVGAGVDAVIRYPQPIHLQPAFAEFGWRCGQFPVAESLARELLCLPIRPDLQANEIEYVCEQVGAFFQRAVKS
jgi:dTDP-4-amino-4,6-dideoxygalactose transaminase